MVLGNCGKEILGSKVIFLMPYVLEAMAPLSLGYAFTGHSPKYFCEVL